MTDTPDWPDEARQAVAFAICRSECVAGTHLAPNLASCKDATYCAEMALSSKQADAALSALAPFHAAALAAQAGAMIADFRDCVDAIRSDREFPNHQQALGHSDGMVWAKARMGHKLDEIEQALPCADIFAAALAAQAVAMRDQIAEWHSDTGWLLDEDDVADAIRAFPVPHAPALAAMLAAERAAGVREAAETAQLAWSDGRECGLREGMEKAAGIATARAKRLRERGDDNAIRDAAAIDATVAAITAAMEKETQG